MVRKPPSNTSKTIADSNPSLGEPITQFYHDSAGGEAYPIEQMVRAAELYYDLGLTQQEVASQMNVSRPTVSRLLQQARERDIVRISVVNPRSRAAELERRLVQEWGLHAAVVAPTTVTKGPLLLRKLAEAGVQYLEHNLPPGVHIGIGLGRTVYELVHTLEGVRPHPQIVPLCGGTVFSESAYHVNEIARVAAQKMGGYCHYLHAPAETSNGEAYAALLADASVAKVMDLWDKLDWAVIGIGSATHADTSEFQDFLDRAKSTGAKPVADICHTLIDGDGNPCHPPGAHLIAITLDQLRRTPRVMAVAGGTYKIEAIRAALRTGVIDVLLIDEPTAVGVLA